MKRKLITLLLTVVMAFSQLPVFADDNPAVSLDSTKIALIEALGLIEDYDTMPEEIGTQEFKKAFSLLLDNPDETAYENPTYENALQLLVKACGWQFMLDYGKTYQETAAKMGLLKGTVSAEKLDKQSFCKLLINSLDVLVPEISITSNKVKYHTDKDDTLLAVHFDTYKAKGIVTGNCITRLDGAAAVSADYVEIDGEKIKDLTGCGRDFLGQSIRFYYRDTNDEPELLTAFADAASEITVLKADDIEEYKNNSYIYKQGEKTKSIKVSNKASIIYNGQSDNALPSTKFVPHMGEVILIDNDGDDTADVQFVYEYTTWIVSDIDANTNRLALKNTETELIRQLDLDDLKQNKEYEIISSGKNISVDGLAKNNILTMYESRKNYILMYVSDKYVSGILESIDSEEKKVTIDGVKYDVAIADDFIGHTSQNGIYYLDSADIIVWTEFDETNKFGYLINAAVPGNLSDDRLEVKLLCDDGEIRKLFAKDKFLYNNTRVSQNTNIADLWDFSKTQEENVKPIVYRTGKDDKITHIYTAVTGDADDDTFRLAYTLQPRWYNGSLRAFMDTSSLLEFPEPMNVDKKTVIFYVPNDITDDDNYKVGDISGCSWDQYAYSTGYRTTKTNSTDLIVVKGDDARYESTMLIEKVYKSLNDKGDEVAYVRGLMNQWDIQTLEVSPSIDPDELHSGDFIIFYKTRSGQLAHYKKCFDAVADRGLIPSSSGNSERTVYGEVTEFEDGIAVMDGDNGYKYNYNISGCSTVYQFSRNAKKITKSSLSDIHIGDKIYMRMNQERIRIIVIYKN